MMLHAYSGKRADNPGFLAEASLCSREKRTLENVA
jgi:hypothetical protein